MDSHTDRQTLRPRTGRTRGWVPALVAAIVAAGGLWALELLADVAPFAGLRADDTHDTGGVWAGLLGGKITFFGADNNALFGSTDSTVRVLLTTAAVLVVAYVVTWLGTVGLRARAVLPLFLSAWIAAVLAGAAGQVVSAVDLQQTTGIDRGLLASLGSVIDAGAAYGVVYGWIPALLAALAWSATPARRVADADLEAEPDAADPEDADLRSLLDDTRG